MEGTLRNPRTEKKLILKWDFHFFHAVVFGSDGCVVFRLNFTKRRCDLGFLRTIMREGWMNIWRNASVLLLSQDIHLHRNVSVVTRHLDLVVPLVADSQVLEKGTSHGFPETIIEDNLTGILFNHFHFKPG
jgi:hypothetical protein